MPEPIYKQISTTPAYLSLSLFWKERPVPESGWLEPLKECVERDGVRILEHRSKDNTSQFLLSTRPDTAPDKLVAEEFRSTGTGPAGAFVVVVALGNTLSYLRTRALSKSRAGNAYKSGKTEMSSSRPSTIK